MTTVLLVLLGALLLVLAVAFLLRRRFLLSGLGAVTMWLRPVGSPRWSVGVAWYGGDVLLWYRGVSLAVRPHERLCRSELRVESRRRPGRNDLALPSDVVVAAHGGFLSVTERGVSILAETAEMSTEIDVERAREALRRAEDAGDDPDALAAAKRAQSRLRAARQDA